jgi:hypothetical protein
MEGPNEEAEAFIPMENVRDGPNLNRTFTVRRKAAKRTEPWYNYLASPPPPSPQDEAIPARKKPRLDPIISSTAALNNDFIDLCSDSDDEKPKAKEGSSSIDAIGDTYTLSSLIGKKRTPIATAAVEAAAKTALPCVAMALPPPPPVDVDGDAHTDSVADTQSNPRATGAVTSWTPEEDAELTSACKQQLGEVRPDWAAVAALVSGRTTIQCCNRWHYYLNQSIDGVTRRTCAWTEDEDGKLTDAVQLHGGKDDKDWGVIATLVPGRTKDQCCIRWHYYLSHSIDGVTGRTRRWTEDEYGKLKDAVQLYGSKDWGVIATLISGRTDIQCRDRWRNFLKPNIDRRTRRTGAWTEDEDGKLKAAAQLHGSEDWGVISTLIPGRTDTQCRKRWDRWLNSFNSSSIDRVIGRTGAWTEDEYGKLKDAVQLHGSKDWGVIATVVPGRTKDQCRAGWRKFLKTSINLVTRRTGAWTEDEDRKLKDAVLRHGGTDWGVITTLVPGRSSGQCLYRWRSFLNKHSSDRVTRGPVTWTEAEDGTLRDAVPLHGDKDWAAIAARVPDRTKGQCSSRWYGNLSRCIDPRLDVRMHDQETSTSS